MRRLSKRDRKRDKGRMGDDKFEDQLETIAISNWLSNTRLVGSVSTVISRMKYSFRLGKNWTLDNKRGFQVDI